MFIPYRDLKKLLCATALLMFGIGTAIAQSYPNKPIRFVVGFSAGSVTDLVARIVANHVKNKLGQTVIVENRTGANGMVAATEMARAQPDGYTVLISNSSTMTLNPLVVKNIQYDVKDFAPISLMVSYPFVLVINPNSEKMASVSTLDDLIKLARNKPDQFSYGTSGLGGLVHLTFELLNGMAGVSMVHVPYRGIAAAQAGVLGGEIDIEGDNPSAIGQIKAGRLKALAVTTPQRWRDLPDVPTVAELGYPGYDMSSWVGAVVRAQTPPGIVKILSDAINSAGEDPTTKALLEKQGNVLMLNPQQFSEKIKAETEVNAGIIKRANINLE